jgi:cytochrome c5
MKTTSRYGPRRTRRTRLLADKRAGVVIRHISAITVLFVSCLSLAACNTGTAGRTGPPNVPALSATADPPQPISPEAMQRWSRSCALCHIDGSGGAPVAGNSVDWAPRLAQGMDVLLAHTVEGLNNMPPLGYCMACERGDFLAMIDFMTRDVAAPMDATP